MIRQPLFWKRVEDDTRALVFKDINTDVVFALTVDSGSMNVSMVGGGRPVSSPFTLRDQGQTPNLYNLVVNDNHIDTVLTETPTSVVDYIALTDTVTGEHYWIVARDGEIQISEAPLAEVYGLAELLPKVYPDSDADGSLADFIKVYDDQHTEQRAIVEQLATIRTPSLAPLAFVPNIADAMGSPFPFMSAHRWQRGNRLSGLPRIYAERGSAQGIINAIRYLIGVEVDVVTYQWILGVSKLPPA